MAGHVCTKEKEIDKMSKAVYGNGEDGLVQNVAAILTKVNSIEETLSGLQTGVSGLLKFQTAITTERDFIEKRKLNSWQITSILGTLILSVGAIIASIIFNA